MNRKISLQCFTVYPDTVAQQGRDLADDWLNTPPEQREDGILLTDDWVALGFLERIRGAGIQVPKDVRIVVACNRNMLAEFLVGCDRLALDLTEVAETLVQLLRKQMEDPTSSAIPIDVPYRPYPG